MARYLIRRLFWAIVLFIAVTAVTYVIFYLVPSDPARAFAGKAAGPQEIERAREYLGLDQPIWKQYYDFLRRLVMDGSLGFSYTSRREVTDILKDAAPVTASLVFGGAIAWMTLALPIGILSALRPRSLGDRAAMGFVLIGVAAHPVWLGLIFLYFISYRLGWTPISGYCNFFGSTVRRGHLRRAQRLVRASDIAVDHVRDPERGALRAHAESDRDGDDERGLRAHRAREGRAGPSGHALARAAQRDAAGGDDVRHGHRPRPGRRDLHRVGLQFGRSRQDGHPGLRRTTTSRSSWGWSSSARAP